MRSSEGTVIGSSSLGVDITDRLAAEMSQLEQQKLESLGRMAATVAHDFNNLLTVMATATGLLERTPGDVSLLTDMNDAIRQAAGLTRALLAYARREAIAPKLLSVDDVVVATWPMLQNLVGHELRLTQSLGAPRARVVIDETQLRQVMINLLGNAADATRGHGNELRIATNVVVLEPDQAKARGLIAEGAFVVVAVADDGRGMGAEQLERAFDPFFTTKEKGQGTGLGLAMCASIVQRAGGFISVDSEPLRGTTFRVHLPAAQTGDPTSEHSPGRNRSGAPAGGGTVLVVEDSEPIRNLITSVLTGQGLEVIAVSDLEGARGVLANRRFDVLLTDGTLPDGDGEELAREGIERRQVGRAILISGSAMEAEATIFDAVIPKPFRVDLLVGTVLRLVND